MKQILQNKKIFYSIICILLGIMIYLILEPYILHHRQEKYSQALIKAFEKGDGEIHFNPEDVIVPGEGVEPSPVKDENKKENSIRAIGVVDIPKINLKAPVVEGATDENLRIALGHYSPSIKIGEKGVSILFGHNMKKYGLFFNRLHELGVGDKIFYSEKDVHYQFKVISKSIVSAEKLDEIVQSQTNNSELMLITCQYVGKVKNRLVVEAELDSSKSD